MSLNLHTAMLEASAQPTTLRVLFTNPGWFFLCFPSVRKTYSMFLNFDFVLLFSWQEVRESHTLYIYIFISRVFFFLMRFGFVFWHISFRWLFGAKFCFYIYMSVYLGSKLLLRQVLLKTVELCLLFWIVIFQVFWLFFLCRDPIVLHLPKRFRPFFWSSSEVM